MVYTFRIIIGIYYPYSYGYEWGSGLILHRIEQILALSEEQKLTEKKVSSYKK